jgi:hypothetical protein
MDHAAALQLVYEGIDVANELRRADDQLPKTPDVKLVGADGRLDSLALATLLLAVERRIEETTGASISLLDDGEGDPESQVEGLATPDALAALILEKIG